VSIPRTRSESRTATLEAIDPMLKIYGRRNSHNVQKVLWLVGELGLDHLQIDAGGPFGGLDEPSYRAMNPHGRVPVIDDDGATIWESHTILRYLAARYGANQGLWSDDAFERSQTDRWMDWTTATLQPDFLHGVFWGFYRTPEDRRNLPLVEAKVKLCGRHFQLIDALIGRNRYLLGDDLALADISIGTCLYRYFNLEIERPALANVEAWYDRLQSRPAFRDHVMIPFDDLFGRLGY
jgi:glutathione S-transferase